MSNEHLQPSPDLAGRPEVTKFIVEEVMDEVELNGLSPSVQLSGLCGYSRNPEAFERKLR